jgi:hypothetical protein
MTNVICQPVKQSSYVNGADYQVDGGLAQV